MGKAGYMMKPGGFTFRAPTFQRRLKVVLKAGNLRVADLAWWFERRHSTVSGWVKDGREPEGTVLDVARLVKLLQRLEVAVATPLFPFINITRKEREYRLKRARSGRKV